MADHDIPPHMADLVLTTLTDDDFDAFRQAEDRGFHDETPVDHLELVRTIIEPDRCFGFKVGERWVSTFGTFPRQLTVPGGASIPVSAVTAVTVHTAYRRRGLLRQMMTRELELARERGEIATALYASDSGIYGRFGYGCAVPRVKLSGPMAEMGFRRDAGRGPMVDAVTDDPTRGIRFGGSVDEVSREVYLAAAPPLHDRLRSTRPGSLDRPADWWQITVAEASFLRDGASALRYVVSYNVDGTLDGHATYRFKGGYSPDGFNGEVRIGEVEGATSAAYARLLRYLFDLELAKTFVRKLAPADDPITQLVASPRSINIEVSDGLYVRLLDVQTALAERRYAADLDLVLEVRDESIPDNAGRYAIRGGRDSVDVSRTDAKADLVIDVRELGAAYLGGTSFGALYTAGLVAERRPGAVAEASAAFGWVVAPFCADFF